VGVNELLVVTAKQRVINNFTILRTFLVCKQTSCLFRSMTQCEVQLF